MFKLRATRGTGIALFLAAGTITLAVVFMMMSAVETTAAAGTAPSVEPPVPPLSTADIQVLRLGSTQEVTLSSTSATPVADGGAQAAAAIGVAPPQVTRARAVKLAEDYVGRYGHPERVYLAAALGPVAGHMTSEVWIVLFAGGTAPMAGPTDGPTFPPLSVTGVLVDAQTGDVLEVFAR